jgi:hypothetical protein
MHQVIALLAPDLGDDVGQRREARASESGQADRVSRVVQPAPDDRETPAVARRVEQSRMAVFRRLAMERDPVGILTGQRRAHLVKQTRVADLVLRQ